MHGGIGDGEAGRAANGREAPGDRPGSVNALPAAANRGSRQSETGCGSERGVSEAADAPQGLASAEPGGSPAADALQEYQIDGQRLPGGD